MKTLAGRELSELLGSFPGCLGLSGSCSRWGWVWFRDWDLKPIAFSHQDRANPLRQIQLTRIGGGVEPFPFGLKAHKRCPLGTSLVFWFWFSSCHAISVKAGRYCAKSLETV